MENVVCYLPDLYHGPTRLDCLHCLHLLLSTIGIIIRSYQLISVSFVDFPRNRCRGNVYWHRTITAFRQITISLFRLLSLGWGPRPFGFWWCHGSMRHTAQWRQRGGSSVEAATVTAAQYHDVGNWWQQLGSGAASVAAAVAAGVAASQQCDGGGSLVAAAAAAVGNAAL